MTHTFQPGTEKVQNYEVPPNYIPINTMVYSNQPMTMAAPLAPQYNVRKSRTNFVTSDGYDANDNIRQIDQILT